MSTARAVLLYEFSLQKNFFHPLKISGESERPPRRLGSKTQNGSISICPSKCSRKYFSNFFHNLSAIIVMLINEQLTILQSPQNSFPQHTLTNAFQSCDQTLMLTHSLQVSTAELHPSPRILRISRQKCRDASSKHCPSGHCFAHTVMLTLRLEWP